MATEKELLAKLALLAAKQDKLTAGNGISINQNTDTISGTTVIPTLNAGFKIGSVTNKDGVTQDLYSPDPKIVETTQAQYEELTYYEKTNGTAYFITDTSDIFIWVGTESEYLSLSQASKLKKDTLYFIYEDDEQEE